VSTTKDFTTGGFKEVIDDETGNPRKVIKVVFCNGKLYYDLLAERERLNNDQIALIRIEQLYPFPTQQVKAVAEKYPLSKTFIWAQEEPANMGAWNFIHDLFGLNIPLKLVARPASGSPATGSGKFHTIRQQKILDKVMSECNCPYLEKSCEMVCIGNKWKQFEKELKDMHVDHIDSKFHSGVKPLN
jgi:2-oxoglutarate dehydrogenase E1 component